MPLRGSYAAFNFVHGNDYKNETEKCYMKLKLQTLEEYKEHCNKDVALNMDGSLLLTSGGDNPKLWCTKTGKLKHQFEGHKSPVKCVAMNRDGRFLLTVEYAESKIWINVWDTQTYKCLRTVAVEKMHSTVYIKKLACSPDGKLALSLLDNSGRTAETDLMKLWDLSTGKCLQSSFYFPCMQPIGHGYDRHDRVYSAAISQDGRLALTNSRDNQIRLWDAWSGECLSGLEVALREGTHISFCEDSRFAVVGNLLWNTETGEYRKIIDAPESATVAVSGNGRKALFYQVSPEYNHIVTLWDTSTSECIATLEEDIKLVNSLSFSYDGCTLALGGCNGIVELWHLENEQTLDLGECRTIAELRGFDYPDISNFLENFLTLRTPYSVPQSGEMSTARPYEHLPQFTRHGKPVWSEDDLKQLMYTLHSSGFPEVSKEEVHKKLKDMTATWDAPPPLGRIAPLKKSPERINLEENCRKASLDQLRSLHLEMYRYHENKVIALKKKKGIRKLYKLFINLINRKNG